MSHFLLYRLSHYHLLSMRWFVLTFRCYHCRFHGFFNQIDQFKSNHFLWLTAGGLKVAELNKETESGKPQQDQDVDKALGDEDEEDPEGGEG